jgi:hypothetical protein
MGRKITIIGLFISDRMKQVSEVQKIFTEYGCHIKTRLGIHEASDDICSPGGLVLLETVGDEKKIEELLAKLKKLTGLQVNSMVFKQ